MPHIHPELNRMLDYRDYVVETARWHSLQHSPLASDAALYEDGEAPYWLMWPNTPLNVLPDHMQTNRVIPLAPGKCLVTFDYFYRPAPPTSSHAMPATTRSAIWSSARTSTRARSCSAVSNRARIARTAESQVRKRHAPFP
jgi:hypothetical protein